MKGDSYLFQMKNKMVTIYNALGREIPIPMNVFCENTR